ncbi:Acetyl esterase/lipase [Pseudarcicella hirudinis]|uniref:Acetyl esterase/lipase n=1 Tax=Pseudarcicella hirudinis TaxID=1079859 RepID=A0A1I5URR8_9BACT|nr:GDSL-type esterase/lipase family protein [Pseudarcicella hirudinis]SFP97919.1 Acetyl esterase/lipase [Pseudarcicella hirudinis]
MKFLSFFFCTFLLYTTSYAQEVIKLYPGKAPGSENWTWSEAENNNNLFKTRIIYNVTDPSITAYLPDKEKATGTAVLIAPGGAFHTLSIDSEGNDVAKYLNAKGVAAFVLKYRVARSFTDDPVKELMGKMSDFRKLDEENAPVIPLAIQDALTALKYIRKNAEKYEVDPNKIGIMGFSAGGTLTLGAAYQASEEARPNFIAPIYAYTAALESIKNIPKAKTPTFIALASDDQLGFAPANAQLYLDWKAAGQPVEMHIYERGGHGFGMNKQKIPTDYWYERFGEWLKLQGYLKKRYPNKWEKQFSEEQIEEFSRKNAEREKRDWAYLSKYKNANAQLTASKTGKARVVFTGDSITEGWVTADQDYFEKNNYVGRGISGQTSPQTLLRFRQDVIALKPSVVVINIGINDIAENTGDYMQDYTLANYQSMIEIAKANNIKVVLASVLPAASFPWRKEIKDVPAKVIALNEGIKNLAGQYHLVYLDYFNVLKDERNGLSKEMAEDGVHPTLPCYKIMEKLADDAVNKALK